MLLRYFLQSLWNIMIVGRVIMRYAWMHVPYLLSENPDLNLVAVHVGSGTGTLFHTVLYGLFCRVLSAFEGRKESRR